MLKSLNKNYIFFFFLFCFLYSYSLTNLWLHSEDVYFDENYLNEDYFSNIFSKDIVIWGFYIKRWLQAIIDNFIFPYSLTVYSHHFFRILTFFSFIYAACYLFRICNKIHLNNNLNFFLVLSIFNLPAIIFYNFLSSGFTIFWLIIILIYIFDHLNQNKNLHFINYFFYFFLFTLVYGIYPFYCFIFLSFICLKLIFINNIKELKFFVFNFFGFFTISFFINFLISNFLNNLIWKIISSGKPYPNFNHALYNGDLSDFDNIVYKMKRYILEWIPNETNLWNIHISNYLSITIIILIIIFFLRSILINKKNLNLFFFKILIFGICYSIPICAWLLIKADIHSFRIIFPSQVIFFLFIVFLMHSNNFFQFNLFKYFLFLLSLVIFINSFYIIRKQVKLNLKELNFIEKNFNHQNSHIHYKLRPYDGKNINGDKFYYSEFFMPATFRWSELDRFTKYSLERKNRNFIVHDCSDSSFLDNQIHLINKCYKKPKNKEIIVTFESPENINQKILGVRQRWYIYKKHNINIKLNKSSFLFLNLNKIK